MDMSEEVCNEVCFALVESPVNGIVTRMYNTDFDFIVEVIEAWAHAGGLQALEAAKPDAYLSDDNWVSMPRSVLDNYDISFGDLGDGKIVAMYIRVAEVLSRVHDGAPAAPVLGVPVAEPA
jgi:hypothetical protein